MFTALLLGSSRTREKHIRVCMATFPEGIAYPKQVAERLGWPYKTVHSDMRRMARKGRGIHNLGQSRTVCVRA